MDEAPDRDPLDGMLFALDRLALGFESADPHIRYEAKSVARQNIGGIARECSLHMDSDS